MPPSNAADAVAASSLIPVLSYAAAIDEYGTEVCADEVNVPSLEVAVKPMV